MKILEKKTENRKFQKSSLDFLIEIRARLRKTGRFNEADGIRSGLLQSLNSSKPRFRTMGLSIRGWEKQGYVSDPRKTKKDVFEDVKFDDIVDFYSAYIKGKAITITIVGNKDKIDMEKLSQFGEVIEVKKEDIFN